MKTLINALILSLFFNQVTLAAEVNLTQDQVLKLTESQSPEVQKLRNIRASQELLYAQSTAELNFNLSAGFQKKNSKFRSLVGFTNIGSDSDIYTAEISKLFSTGTNLSATVSRSAIGLQFEPTATPPSTQTTEDVFTFGISQDLWSNFFGAGSRAAVEAAAARLTSSAIQTELQFEATVIQNLQLFWKAVTSKKIVEETEISLKRYSNLVNQVKKKSSFGTAQPGELSQVQAEFEAKSSALEASKDVADADIENLKTALNLSAGDKIILNPRPVPASLNEIKSRNSELTGLRRFKALELEKKSAMAASSSAESRASPKLAAFLQYGSQGLNEDSVGQVTRSKYPETVVGLRFSQTFGNGLNQKIKAAAQSEASNAQIDFNLSVQRLNDRAQALFADLKTASSVYNSLLRERDFRARAANEYTRAFNQGRVDIQNLIQVLNSTSTIEAQLARAQGQYETLLLEWTYFNDLKN